MKTLLITVCGLLLATTGFGKKPEPPLIYLDPGDTLHIQVMEYIGLDNVGRNHRFYNFKSTLEEILEEIDFPLEYSITRTGSRRTPEGEPRLDLTILKWGDNGMSQIEARFIASLKQDYNRNKLGVFYYRGGGTLATSDQLTRTYNDVLRKALVKLVTELNGRIVIFDSLLEEDIEIGDELDKGLNE